MTERRTRSSPDQAWSGLADRHARVARAFTLLEVILALAILGLALAAFGQAVGWSHDNARRAARQTDLAIVAASVMDELLCGVRELVAVDRAPYGDATTDPAATPAVVSIAIDSGVIDGLLAVRVRVEPNDPQATARDSVELTRWMLDPSLTSDADSAAAGATP